MKNFSTIRAGLAVALFAGAAGSGFAGVTAEEAALLGTKLTHVGAQKEGNADKSIPDYTGGLTKPPVGYQPGSGIRPDPFEGEKPLYTITAKNAAEYNDRLTAGAKELLKRHASFRIDVYRTHRTVAFQKGVLDNTLKNATGVVAGPDGLSVKNLMGGFPFPIPKNGTEVMWNHILRPIGGTVQYRQNAFNVDANGRATLASQGEIVQQHTLGDLKRTTPLGDTEPFERTRLQWFGPARRVGEALMVHDSQHSSEQPRRAWLYLPGQRRVKLAPEVGHDTPNPGTAGMTTYDDARIFNGSTERYDLKLVGKREMIVPYNGYKITYHKEEKDYMGPGHLNPDFMRWELHRVWVVEATLKPGKRHVYAKRVFYIDEDSWAAVAADMYDARGQLYRASFESLAPAYEVPAVPPAFAVTYDFVQQSYALMTTGVARYYGYKYVNPLPLTDWAPDSLAGTGIR